MLSKYEKEATYFTLLVFVVPIFVQIALNMMGIELGFLFRFSIGVIILAVTWVFLFHQCLLHFFGSMRQLGKSTED